MADFPTVNVQIGDEFQTSKVNYRWTGYAWEALGVAGELSDLIDVDDTTPLEGQALMWDTSGTPDTWKPMTITTANGEINTASNVESGSGVEAGFFKEKDGVDLRFKSIRQGTNITVTENTNDITITASGNPTTAAPAGGPADVQFNDGNSEMDGSSDFRWDNTNKEIIIGPTASDSTHTTASGYASIYAKEHTDDVGEVLFNFDTDLTSSGTATLGTIIAKGSGSRDENEYKFGTASFLFTSSGEGDYLKIPYATTPANIFTWDGAFTIDCWFKLTSPATTNSYDKCFFSTVYSASTSVAGLAVFYRPPSHASAGNSVAGAIYVRIPAGGSQYTAVFQMPSTTLLSSLGNSFHHLAVIRTSTGGGGLAVYLNGVSLIPHPTLGTLGNNGTGTCNPTSVSGDFVIGRFQGDSTGANDSTVTADEDFDGWIDEIRIMKGVAAYTADFTPQGGAYNTTPYTRVYAQSSDGTTSELTTVGNTGDNWTNDVHEATLDGVVALKAQESSPDTSFDHSLLYAVDVPSLTNDADIYIPGNENDLSLNVGTSAVGCHHINLQANTFKTGPAGIEELIPLRWPAGYHQSPSAVYIDDHADTRYPGEFAIDFWYRHSLESANSSTYRGFLISDDKSRNLGELNNSVKHAFYLSHTYNNSDPSYPNLTFYYDKLSSADYASDPLQDGDNSTWEMDPTDFISEYENNIYYRDRDWHHVAITRDSSYRMHVFYNGYCVRTNTQVASDVSYAQFGYPDEVTVAASNGSPPYIGEGGGWKFGHARNIITTQVGPNSNQNTPIDSHSGWMCGFRFKKGNDRGWNIGELSTSTPPNTGLDDRAYFNPPSETLSIPTSQMYVKSEGGTLTQLSNPGFKRSGSDFPAKAGTVQLLNDADILQLTPYLDGSNLPSSDPGVSGRIWNDGGTLKVST